DQQRLSRRHRRRDWQGEAGRRPQAGPDRREYGRRERRWLLPQSAQRHQRRHPRRRPRLQAVRRRRNRGRDHQGRLPRQRQGGRPGLQRAGQSDRL
ncbi:MAG: hypothetical protein AVDCRST_MAG39-2142, partial [uncultured Sphingomonadaceae bacterium]